MKWNMYLIIFNLKIWFILNKKPILPKKVLCHMKNTLVFCEIKLFELFMLSSRFLIQLILIKSLNSYVKSFVFIKKINFPVWLISTEVYGATHFCENLENFEIFKSRDLLTQKKRVNFHTFGLDPLKSVKLKNFFSHTLTETYFGNKNLFFHL